MSAPGTAFALDPLLQLIERHWGFRSLRPLQERAMRAVLEGRDSVVVLPTGGGKSLCYQAPAVLRGGTTVVISPLLALMKDQVDNLQASGIQAARIDSSQSPDDRKDNERLLAQGLAPLLFVSPERLTLNDFCHTLRRLDVETKYAIPFHEVIDFLGQARFGPVFQRPLFNHLGLVTNRTFETLCADTIPLLMLPGEMVEAIHGPDARSLVPDGDVAGRLEDMIARPEAYWDAVANVRAHLAEHHSYERRFEELLGVLGS